MAVAGSIMGSFVLSFIFGSPAIVAGGAFFAEGSALLGKKIIVACTRKEEECSSSPWKRHAFTIARWVASFTFGVLSAVGAGVFSLGILGAVSFGIVALSLSPAAPFFIAAVTVATIAGIMLGANACNVLAHARHKSA